jgi:hypothetical protein
MFFRLLIDMFAAYINYEASYLPSVTFETGLGLLAMWWRWCMSFDLVFDMPAVVITTGITFAVTTGVASWRIFATLWNLIRGSGA